MNTRVILIMILSIIFVTCSDQYDYATELEKEMSSGQRNDHIVLDIDFGMERQAFYDYCWKLNNDQKAGQGPLNRSVKVELEDFDKKAHMLFYPNFKDDRIIEMPILFAYEDWSPWNKDSFSNKIIFEVRDLANKWYNIELKLVKDSTGYPGYVSVKGNKRITLTIQDDHYAKLLVTDLSAMDTLDQTLTFKRN